MVDKKVTENTDFPKESFTEDMKKLRKISEGLHVYFVKLVRFDSEKQSRELAIAIKDLQTCMMWIQENFRYMALESQNKNSQKPLSK